MMEAPEVPELPEPPEAPDDQPDAGAAAVTGAAYGTLVMLGLILGVVGGLEHSWYAGGVPVAAIGWVLALFALPYAIGRLTRSRLAPLVLVVAWLVMSFVLAGRRPEGDLAIAADSSGYLYLYGGAVAVALAVVLSPSRGPSRLLRSWAPGSHREMSEESSSVFVDRDLYRKVAGRYATGIAIVTTRTDGVDHAMTVNSLASVSLDPILTLFCAEKIARFHDAVLEAGVWGVSVLGEEDEEA